MVRQSRRSEKNKTSNPAKSKNQTRKNISLGGEGLTLRSLFKQNGDDTKDDPAKVQSLPRFFSIKFITKRNDQY